MIDTAADVHAEASDSRRGHGAAEPLDDHFVTCGDREFAGTHLILDVWDAHGLDEPRRIERALRTAAQAAGATLLHLHLHRFTPSGGISGVAVLAESHISVHTWPERGFAAFDVFMCGNTRPERALETLMSAFDPARYETVSHRRGEVELA